MTNPLTVTMSRSTLPAVGGEGIVGITVTAPVRRSKAQSRMPCNIAVALDVSSSMRGAKITHGKAAAQKIVARLESQDYCAVVTFSHESAVLMPSAAMTESGRAALIAEIEKTEARGSTALYDGWRDAVACIEHATNGAPAIQRVFLLTDGEANTGPSNPEYIAPLVAIAQQRGISTSTFGLGEGYNEQLLGMMASAGEGNTYFIADADNIDTYFGQELNQLYTTTVRNAQLSITLPESVACTVVGNRNHSRCENRIDIPLGAMLSGESRQLILYLSSTANLTDGVYAIAVGLAGVDEQSAPFLATCHVPLIVAPQSDIIAEDLERRAALIDKAAIVADALALHQKRDYAGALALIAERKQAFPFYARFGVYDEELVRFRGRIQRHSMKRMRMHSNDMVNSSPATLEKYRTMLRILRKKGGPAEEIVLLEEQILALEEKYNLQ